MISPFGSTTQKMELNFEDQKEGQPGEKGVHVGGNDVICKGTETEETDLSNKW